MCRRYLDIIEYYSEAPEHGNFCKEHYTGACAETIDRTECISEE